MDKSIIDSVVCSNVGKHPDELCKNTCILWKKCGAYKLVKNNTKK